MGVVLHMTGANNVWRQDMLIFHEHLMQSLLQLFTSACQFILRKNTYTTRPLVELHIFFRKINECNK